MTEMSVTGYPPEHVDTIDYEAAWEKNLNTLPSILRDILAAVSNRSDDPPRSLWELGRANLGHLQFRGERIVLTNTDAATQTFTLTVGSRIFTFKVPTTQTLDLPFPYVFARGVDIILTTTGGAGTATGYLVGFEG